MSVVLESKRAINKSKTIILQNIAVQNDFNTKRDETTELSGFLLSLYSYYTIVQLRYNLPQIL